MKHYYLLFAIAFLACDRPVEKQSISIENALGDIKSEEFEDHLTYLSSDDLKGRFPGEAGYDSAAAYVERNVRNMGLAPAGVEGSYRQPIQFTKSTLKPSQISAKMNGEELVHGTDFIMPAVHEDVSFSGEVVFIGAGIDAPELGYSDLENVDVEGKVVMFIWRTMPDSFGAIERAVHGNIRGERLREKGIAGLISVIPPDVMSKMPWPLLTWLVSRPSMRYETKAKKPYRSGILVGYETAAKWLEKDGKDFADLVSGVKEGNSTSFQTDLFLEVNASSNRETIISDNVVAKLEGVDPKLKDEHLVITAHLDHDGISTPVENDSIYNGTIDNASGSAALLVLADKLSKMETKRSIIFLWVTAEERGLLGSEYFAKYPTIDASKIVANQNMDGIVNLISGTKDVIAYGYEHSNLSQSVDHALAKLQLERSEDPRPEETFFVRSDQYSFVAEGIPAIWVTAGFNSLVDSVDAGAAVDNWLVTRYHKPNDDLDQPLNFEAAVTELKYNLIIAEHIVNQLDVVEWNTDGFLYKTFVEN